MLAVSSPQYSALLQRYNYKEHERERERGREREGERKRRVSTERNHSNDALVPHHCQGTQTPQGTI